MEAPPNDRLALVNSYADLGRMVCRTKGWTELGVRVGNKVVISGLTAAGKTTHARLLSTCLSYKYVSATSLIAQILGLGDEDERRDGGFWLRNSTEIARRREIENVDEKLDAELYRLAANPDHLIIDAWAVPWLVDGHNVVKVWLESDLSSRTKKAAVSDNLRQPAGFYSKFIQDKDLASRQIFQKRYNFDLFDGNGVFDIVLDNSRYIEIASRDNADIGIANFHPIILSEVQSMLTRRRLQ